ncbi:hypothetical protein ACQKK5_00380 [Brevibacillus panacihumi]|uniref:hypothetical protein n=1 Tax=Brevibacillus panacihumi TaxID=497735 RepID=UPI003D069832
MKRFVMALVAVFALTLPLSAVRAEEGKAMLGKADVSIEVKDGVYFVTEQIQLLHPNHAPDGKLEHTISKLNGVSAENLRIATGNEDLTFEEQDGDALQKVFVQMPEAGSDAFDYSISYQVALPDGEYKLPLFVPMYAAEKGENLVHISFQAPEGMVVQPNSFPIVIENNQNRVESHMINLPSHVSYLFGDSAPVVNSHTLISAVTLVILFLILFVWARVERRNAQRGA